MTEALSLLTAQRDDAVASLAETRRQLAEAQDAMTRLRRECERLRHAVAVFVEAQGKP